MHVQADCKKRMKFKNLLIRYTFLITALFGTCYAERAVIARPSSFHFKNYLNLRTGDQFQIIASSGLKQEQVIGTGRIYKLSAQRLHLQFKANPGGMSIEGSVRLTFLKREGEKLSLKLDYRGVQSGLSRQNSEVILVDSFLADNGILSLHYASRKYFLQLSRNRAGHNKFITDWGSARLIKK